MGCHEQIYGLTIDANKIGELCLASFCVIIYYMLVGKQKAWRILSMVSMGAIIGQTYLTQSRTTILAMAFIAGFYLIISVKGCCDGKRVWQTF